MERSSKTTESPSYDVKDATKLERDHAGSWSERALSRWLEELEASDVGYHRRGADIYCKAESALGPVTVRMLSPFKAARGVKVVCEPCLLRAEVGAAPTQMETWSIAPGRGESVTFWATAEGWAAGVLLPMATASRLGSSMSVSTWLDPVAFGAFFGRIGELARMDREARIESMWEECSTLAESVKRPGPWVGLSSLRSTRWQRARWPRVREKVAALKASASYEAFEARRIGRIGWGASILTSDGEREVSPCGLFVDAQVRGRADRGGATLEATLLTLDASSELHSVATLLPRDSIIARVTLGGEEGSMRRRSTWGDRGPSVVYLWLDDEQLRSGELAAIFDEVMGPEGLERRGPYR